MTPFIFWLLVGLTFVAEGDSRELKWPRVYTVKATKILLLENMIEHLQIWRTKTKSRIDYNNGVVQTIIKKTKKFRKGVRYYIHPEASLNQSSHTVCYAYTRKHGRILPENILPKTYNFIHGGFEQMQDKNTTKFESDTTDGDERVTETLWSIYESETWIPVRYEKLQYNVARGFKTNHEIWEFYEFNTDRVDKVFNTDDYDCQHKDEDDDDDDDDENDYTMNNDAVTKHLMNVDPEDDGHVDHVFNCFKKKFAKSYADEEEHEIRRSIFQNRMRHIIATNNKNLGYKLSINDFSDRTPEELKKYKGLKRRPEGKTGNVAFPYTESKLNELGEDLPKEYDARMFGLVSKVENQGDCGSCWAFGATAAAEGALAKVNGGRLISLAQQALVDCAWAFNGSGCDGGYDYSAYEWMMEYGLPTEAEYGPYQNRDGQCNILNMTKKYPIRGYTDVTPLSITAIKIALVNHGPLSVSVDASTDFMEYSSGIFYDLNCDPKSLNHEVNLVGYGESDGETYWILRNSYGPEWGIDGYMHISAKDNMCGVATEPTYVVF